MKNRFVMIDIIKVSLLFLLLCCMTACVGEHKISEVTTTSPVNEEVLLPKLPTPFFISDISYEDDALTISILSVEDQIERFEVLINGQETAVEDLGKSMWRLSTPVQENALLELVLSAYSAQDIVTSESRKLMVVAGKNVENIETDMGKQVTDLVLLNQQNACDLSAFSSLSFLCLISPETIAYNDGLYSQISGLIISGYKGTYRISDFPGLIAFSYLGTEGSITGDFSELEKLEYLKTQGSMNNMTLNSIAHCDRLTGLEIHHAGGSIESDMFDHLRFLKRLSIADTNLDITIDDLLVLSRLSVLELSGLDMTGEIDDLADLAKLSDVEVIDCKGVESRGVLESRLGDHFFVGTRATGEVIAEEASESILGSYYGEYKNNSGMMNMVIEIINISSENKVTVNFSFSPVEGNKTGKSGSYRLQGTYFASTGVIVLEPDKWLTEEAAGYQMLAIEGTVEDGVFSGKLDREYLPYFTAARK